MKIITASQIDSFKNFIKAHNNFIIVGHKDPDGDCISSSLGVSYILEYYMNGAIASAIGIIAAVLFAYFTNRIYNKS